MYRTVAAGGAQEVSVLLVHSYPGPLPLHPSAGSRGQFSVCRKLGCLYFCVETSFKMFTHNMSAAAGGWAGARDQDWTQLAKREQARAAVQ